MDGSQIGECSKVLDADGIRALTSVVGGTTIRRHHTLRGILAAIGEDSHTSATEVCEPAWTWARTNIQGEGLIAHTRLVCCFTGPPAGPLV